MAEQTTERRGRLDIVYDMLKAVQDKGGSILPTHLLYKSNLSHARLKKYVAELEQKGLLETKAEKGKTRFVLTVRGSEYLANYGKLKGFIDMFGM